MKTSIYCKDFDSAFSIQMSFVVELAKRRVLSFSDGSKRLLTAVIFDDNQIRHIVGIPEDTIVEKGDILVTVPSHVESIHRFYEIIKNKGE